MSNLEQQWQEDIKRFGELAYLMWEAKHKRAKRLIGFSENDDFFWLLERKNNFDIIRKQSAALPFDLVAARSGDEVEMYFLGRWGIDTSINYKNCNIKLIDGYERVVDNENNALCPTTRVLRMKHPRRVGVDYSKFED